MPPSKEISDFIRRHWRDPKFRLEPFLTDIVAMVAATAMLHEHVSLGCPEGKEAGHPCGCRCGCGFVCARRAGMERKYREHKEVFAMPFTPQ